MGNQKQRIFKDEILEGSKLAKLLLKNVCKKYENGSYAVKNINLEVKDKEFVILVGPSGCGKSTTLRMVAGLEEISDGEIWLDDKFANYMSHKERDLSMVFQNYALYPTMSVYDNIAFSLKVRKIDKSEIEERVKETASVMGLSQYLKRMPKELSGGQRQRVAIAAAIIRNPRILLMDEPLSNLDAKLRTHMRVEISKLHKKLNNTIIYVTHDQTEAMTLGSRIVVLKDGMIQQADTPQQIYDNPRNKFVAGFIGMPSMNFIEAEIKKEKNRYYFYFNNIKIFLPKFKNMVIDKKEYENKKVIIGIRPEDISDKSDLENEEYQRIIVKADMSEILGDKTIIHFKAGNKTISSIVKGIVKQGDLSEVFVNTSRIYIFDIDTEENISYDEMQGGFKVEEK